MDFVCELSVCVLFVDINCECYDIGRGVDVGDGYVGCGVVVGFGGWIVSGGDVFVVFLFWEWVFVVVMVFVLF